MFTKTDQHDEDRLRKELADFLLSHAMTLDDDELLNEEQAAEVIDVKPGTLSVWRCTKRYPLKYVKIGRLIRYRRGDLRSFAASRVVG